MCMEGEDLKAAHRAAFCNREDVVASEEVSCFHCLRISPKEGVVAWTDAGETALCPHCGIDAVLPGRVDSAFLTRMSEYHFLRIART